MQQNYKSVLREAKELVLLFKFEKNENMATAILIHNPTAGNGKHGKKELMKAIKGFGYEVKYFSTDVPGWERFAEHSAEVIFVAGGDGTVQKLVKVLRKADKEMQHVPVQVLPLGTANNIAETLGLKPEIENLLDCKNTVGFDTGEVNGPGEAGFFIEGIGFGIFPKLVKVMEAKEEAEGEKNPEEELQGSLKRLLNIVADYEACEAIIIADKEEVTGRFLLVELMNIRYIGPNFELAPHANPGDGNFELVAVPEESRELLQNYIGNLLEGKGQKYSLEEFALLRLVKSVRMKWGGEDVHIDDESLESYKGEEFEVKNQKQTFTFRVP